MTETENLVIKKRRKIKYVSVLKTQYYNTMNLSSLNVK